MQSVWTGITTANMGLAKVAAQCSADIFMVIQTLVLHINPLVANGKNRQLLLAAKPYAVF